MLKPWGLVSWPGRWCSSLAGSQLKSERRWAQAAVLYTWYICRGRPGLLAIAVLDDWSPQLSSSPARILAPLPHAARALPQALVALAQVNNNPTFALPCLPALALIPTLRWRHPTTPSSSYSSHLPLCPSPSTCTPIATPPSLPCRRT